MDVFKTIEEKAAEVAAHLKAGLPTLQQVEGTVAEDAVKVAHVGADALTWLGAQVMQDIHRIANALEILASSPVVGEVEHGAAAVVADVTHKVEATLDMGLTQAQVDQAALDTATQAQEPDVAHQAMIGG